MTIDQLLNTIRQSRHKHLYHFTDEANFPSIRKRGLVSKDRMRSEGWWPEATGGSKLSHDLDTKRGVDQYISLSFTDNHPMLYHAKEDGRLSNPWYLLINPEILKKKGTKISLGVANANDAEWLSVDDAIERLDVEVIYHQTDWDNPAIKQRLDAARKFEILVPDNVPKSLILKRRKVK